MEELVISGVPGWKAIRHTVEVPIPRDDELLVKVLAVGLNPKDWKYTEDLTEDDALNAGDDVAGVVESVGSAVSEYAPGDRVAGLHRLGEPAGGYAQFAILPATTSFRIPPAISFEEAATVPLCSMTAAIALYQALRLPTPMTPDLKNSTPVLIYGGSSAVGSFALQLAKLSGLNPIITVAGNGIDLVQSLGAATHVVDYRKGNTAYLQTEIRRVLDGKPLLHAFDCVGLNQSWEVAGGVLASGGQLEMIDWGNVLDWDPINDKPGPNAWKPPTGINLHFTLVSSAYGTVHDWNDAIQAASDGEFARVFYRYISRLLAMGKLKPHPHAIVPNGLNGILQSLEDLQKGKVSALKLVARINDTPNISN